MIASARKAFRKALPALVLLLAMRASYCPAIAAGAWQDDLSAANSLIAAGNRTDAEKQFVLAWQDVSQNGQPMDQLLVALKKGNNEIDLNDYTTALSTFQAGAAIARRNNLLGPLGDMLAYSAECYREQKSYDLALSTAREARSYYQSQNDPSDEAFTFVVEGRVDQDQQKYDLALAAFNQSLALDPFNFAAVRGAAECDQSLDKYADCEQLLLAALPHETGDNSAYTSRLLADGYFKWAQLLAKQQDEANAMRYARQAIGIYNTVMPLRAAETLTWVGSYLLNRGEIQKSLVFSKSALDLSRKTRSDILEVDALTSLALDYQASGQSDLAMQSASEAIKTAQKANDDDLLFKAYQAASLEADANGYGDLLRTYENDEWRYANRSGIQDHIETAANDLGSYASFSRDFPSALAWFEKATKLYSPGENSLPARQTLLDLGMAYGAMDDLALAQQNFIQAEKLSDQSGDFATERSALIADAMFQARSHRDDVVISDLTQLLRLLKSQRENADPTGQLAVQIGNVFLSVHQVEPAKTVLARAIALARQSESKDVEGQADQGLAGIEDQDREYQRALISYQAALSIYTAAGNKTQMAQTLLAMAFDENRIGDKAKAKGDIYQSIALQSSFNDPATKAMTLSMLGYLYATEGNLEAAASVEKTSINILQNMRQEIAAVNAFYDTNFIRDYRPFYVHLAEVLIQQGRFAEAQQVIGLIKVHEFDQFTSRGGAGLPSVTLTFTPSEAVWRTRYQVISSRITSLGQTKDQLTQRQAMARAGQGTFTAQDQKKLAAVNSDLAVAAQAFQAFLETVPKELSKPDIAEQKTAEIVQAAGLRTTLRTLGHGSVLVYTLVEDDKYRAIVVTDQTEKAEQYPIDSRRLSAKIFAFRDLIQDPDSDPRPAAKELYKIIVGPIEKDLAGAGAKTIMWSLDGVLRYLPISALYDGKQYLVEKYRSDLVTIADRGRLETQPKPNWNVVGMGVSKAQPGFEALPSVPDELHEVVRSTNDPAGVLPGDVMLDDQFTQTAMMDALKGQRYAVVHIASHYSFHPGTDLDSFLLLGDGTHLSLAAIGALPQLFNGVDLVTLSACNTAMGSSGSGGREIDGLALTAQREGSQAVLATLWPIADESTQLFMKNFYSYYETHPGADKADALQYAQLALLHGTAHATSAPTRRGDSTPDAPEFPYDPKAPFSHPYFWAPFILIGNWK
jgi:CHAT domain-containing protein